MKKEDTKALITQVRDELDKISVSSEVIEHLNELINDKLDDINMLSSDTSDKNNIANIFKVLRYNSNYITLNHIITNEIDKINNNVNLAYNLLMQLERQDDKGGETY